MRRTSLLDFSRRRALCLSMGIHPLEAGATHYLKAKNEHFENARSFSYCGLFLKSYLQI